MNGTAGLTVVIGTRAADVYAWVPIVAGINAANGQPVALSVGADGTLTSRAATPHFVAIGANAAGTIPAAANMEPDANHH
jgi:hypothetical protein